MKPYVYFRRTFRVVLPLLILITVIWLAACNTDTPSTDMTVSATDSATGAPTEPEATGGDALTLPADTPTEGSTASVTAEPTDTADADTSAVTEVSTEVDTPAEIMTLAPETVPEPETDAVPIPRLAIYTDNGHDVTSKDDYTHGTATLSNCHEKFAFEGVGVNIRARGNSTFHAPKKPFRLKFDKKQEMLGLNGGKAYKSWVLLADYYDGSMLRTFGTFKFAKALMENKYYSSDCTHVEVYINGEYRGVYLLCEQTQINRGRVDIPEKADGIPPWSTATS